MVKTFLNLKQQNNQQEKNDEIIAKENTMEYFGPLQKKPHSSKFIAAVESKASIEPAMTKTTRVMPKIPAQKYRIRRYEYVLSITFFLILKQNVIEKQAQIIIMNTSIDSITNVTTLVLYRGSHFRGPTAVGNNEKIAYNN